ncbi:MAG: hypothetical protein ACR2IH_02770 [Pyrinomonadaceae bacterium]
MAERSNFGAPADVNRLRTLSLGIGGVALIAWAVGLYFTPEQALRSWLLGFIFWAGIGIGSIGILLLQYLTGGAWGLVMRRIAEAASRTLPMVGLLLVPIVLGLSRLYVWTHLAPTDEVMEQRGWFQTPTSWILRSVIYFAVFGVLAYLLNKWSVAQDRSDNYEDGAKYLGIASKFSGPALVFYALVVTFASVDWVMMLDPHFFSTIWGLLFVAGWALSFFCFAQIILAYLSDKSPMDRVLGPRHFHDIGKLMLAMIMIWAYFNFSQYLIIWSGNVPEETRWFLDRTTNGWGYVAWGLVIFHFAAPFVVLLMQDLKRHPKTLALVASFILLMRLVDMFWLIAPSPRINYYGLEPGAFSLSWLDIIAPVAVGGIWLWYFFGQLMKRPLVPVMDPFFESAIEHGRGH